jgi:hypothetical protein
LIFDFSINYETKNFKNHQCMYRKYLFILISLKKYSSRDIIPSTYQKKPSIKWIYIREGYLAGFYLHTKKKKKITI